MHAVIVSAVVISVLLALALGVAAVSCLITLAESSQAVLRELGAILDDMRNTRQALTETRQSIDIIAPHVVGIRATLESVVRVDSTPKHASVEPQLKQLTESITILREAVETMRADPQDIQAQFNGISESVDLLRSSIHTRAVDPPARLTALEAPQVPKPHGAAKTLLLLNQDRSIAHEVTWHRDVPKTYAYAGRVFELLGVNESGQWEFLPC